MRKCAFHRRLFFFFINLMINKYTRYILVLQCWTCKHSTERENGTHSKKKLTTAIADLWRRNASLYKLSVSLWPFCTREVARWQLVHLWRSVIYFQNVTLFYGTRDCVISFARTKKVRLFLLRFIRTWEVLWSGALECKFPVANLTRNPSKNLRTTNINYFTLLSKVSFYRFELNS